MTRAAAFDMLARVRDELDAVAFALGHATEAWGSDPQFLAAARDADFALDDFRRPARSLELTYLLRLFSEFETVVRHFWTTTVRPTEPGMGPLLDAVAARRPMSNADRDGAHGVRELRNRIIHEGLRELADDFADHLAALGRYLRWLPNDW